MKDLTYIRTSTLEAYIASDGQKLTDLVRRWANVYFRKCGITNREFSINGVSFRPDGGSDGIIESTNCVDPLGFLAPKSVFQFKAGKSTKAEIKAELSKSPVDGSVRIRDYIVAGFTVIWFLGKGLTDIERQNLDKDLREVVEEINSSSPQPVVIDANRLCQCLSKTPAVASAIVSADGLFLTSDVALTENPHARLGKFVPGSHFPGFRDDIVNFFTSVDDAEPIKYIAGEPGIGKSRCVLEAVEQTPSLAGCVCYFSSPTNVKQFFDFAKQEGWSGYCIVDEYIGESASTMAVTQETIPLGLKVVLIGHAHTINRKSVAVTNEMEPLSEDEMVAALIANYPELQEFQVRESIDLSKRNLRLARSVCEFIRQNPTKDLNLNSLEAIVDSELSRMTNGRETLGYLSLVPMLLAENLAEFCAFASLDPTEFRKTCISINQSSGLIQANDHAMYVGAPVLGQIALIRLWRDNRDKVTLMLKNPGRFFDEILSVIKGLPPGADKEEMLSFFKLPVGALTLPELMDPKTGRQLLQLLTADPDTYLPAVHRAIKDHVGNLNEFPYEGASIGRRDLIWRLRDLAQFTEYFEMSEEILYLLVREEVPSGYHNTATTYWTLWFGAYFDHTVYPYERRLALLEARAKIGDSLDRRLVLTALRNPFPRVGSNIPSDRVGGRLAPPELNFIHANQLQLAAVKIPEIYSILLLTEDELFKREIGNQICDACFSWLERGAVDDYLRLIRNENFPIECMRQLIVEVRGYVALKNSRALDNDKRLQYINEQHQKLLQAIDQSDPFLEVIEIGEKAFWGDDVDSESYKRRNRVLVNCLSDESFRQRTIEALVEPTKYGGGSFGRMFGEHLRYSEVEGLIDVAQEKGFSQFSIQALRSFINAKPEIKDALLAKGRSLESHYTSIALTIYQTLGEAVYYAEATRLLNETHISSRFFGGLWLQSAEDLKEYHLPFIRALTKRLEAGDVEALPGCLSIVGAFIETSYRSAEAVELGFLVLQQSDSDSGRNSLCTWKDVGVWLLESDYERVILEAASREQSEFSLATEVLTLAAKQYPAEVLNALLPQLLSSGKLPFLLTGSVDLVLANIDPKTFKSWLPAQVNEVWESIAGQLPRPRMQSGEAFVPEITRAFWDLCTPDKDFFSRAMDEFSAQTFNTGVYTGHGVDLFGTRVELAKQLTRDPNPSLRIWAERFRASSSHYLEDAIRQKNLADARRDIER